VILAFL
jgi:transcriptional regulator with XRE-family HTH domain